MTPGLRSFARLLTAGALAAACAALLPVHLSAAPALLRQAPAQTGSDAEPALVARANDVVDRLASGEVDPIVDQFTDQMKAGLNAERLRALFPALAGQVGAFKSRGEPRTEKRDAFTIVVIPCTFERAMLEAQVVFDAQGRIAGLAVRPPAPTASYEAPSYVTPSAFTSRDVTVDAGGWPLPGTLTMPSSASATATVPAVVMVQGSGPGDRDEAIGPNKPFRDIAEGLASKGIAVLRYDKRTRVHASRMATLTDFTVKEEVIDDAAAAVELLRRTPGVDPARVFVLGHSLGGTLAPRIAGADPAIAGLIIMAGATRPLGEMVVEQTRYLARLDGTVTAEEQEQLDRVEELARSIAQLEPGDPPITSPLLSAPSSYFIDLRDYDPTAAAAALRIPMLILQGERDYQVTADDLARWRAALGSRDDVAITSYPSLNHLFMPGTGPASPAEYTRAGHVDAKVIADISQWVLAH